MPAIFLRLSVMPILATLLFFTMLLPTQSSGAEKKVVNTTITVGEMCGGCVKRITAFFKDVKDVAKVECDVETKTVVLFPAKDVRLSPSKVWETMESIGKPPKKLVGPSGTYTSRPEKL